MGWLERVFGKNEDPSPVSAIGTAPQIGDIERGGEHKGEIYGGMFPDGRPGWILEEPKPMTHYEACELKGRALPTSEEGQYIDTIKGKGALKKMFARHSDICSEAASFWLADHDDWGALYQVFHTGMQGSSFNTDRRSRLPVLSVRR